MIKVYPAVFYKEDSYWVEFPDLMGCQSCGDTIEETMELASEALGLYLADLLESGKELPDASSIKEIETDDVEAIVNYVCTNVDKYRRNTKAVKKTLSIPAWLAEEADNHNLSLSKVLQDGIKQQLGL